MVGVWGIPPDINPPFLARKGAGGWSKRVFAALLIGAGPPDDTDAATTF